MRNESSQTCTMDRLEGILLGVMMMMMTLCVWVWVCVHVGGGRTINTQRSLTSSNEWGSMMLASSQRGLEGL